MKNDLVFSLHQTAVHVFRVGSRNTSISRHIATFPLSKPAANGRFLDDSTTDSDRDDPASKALLRLQYFSVYSKIHHMTISFSSQSWTLEPFSTNETIVLKVDEEKALYACYFGVHAGTFFCLTSSRGRFGMPSAFFVTPKAKDRVNMSISQEVECKRVNDETLPDLRLISCLDFDDGNGLLLMGTTLGDVCIASVLTAPPFTPSSRCCTAKYPPCHPVDVHQVRNWSVCFDIHSLSNKSGSSFLGPSSVLLHQAKVSL